MVSLYKAGDHKAARKRQDKGKITQHNIIIQLKTHISSFSIVLAKYDYLLVIARLFELMLYDPVNKCSVMLWCFHGLEEDLVSCYK